MYCDNVTSVIVINSGATRDVFLQSCLHEICFLAASHQFEIRTQPSTAVRQLIGDIALGVVQVGAFEAVMFHVGTHDIPSTGMGYSRSTDAVVEDFAALLDIVRDFDAHCQVVVSAILPRPVDHLLSWYRVQQVNQRLCSLFFGP